MFISNGDLFAWFPPSPGRGWVIAPVTYGVTQEEILAENFHLYELRRERRFSTLGLA